ncbi:MAG TPA: lipoyl(octanoyl) transferase LipB [Pseudomonadales bacterium]|nr:lipoyl(octanoyl) transferase LipB [Pseudomonadales bacterium]
MAPLRCRWLGVRDYAETQQAQRDFTDGRDAATPDELWLLEHPPVFTQGQAGRAEHLLATGDIPVVQSDRGGQVTYHGPGQLVVYLLIDCRRRGIGVRQLVSAIEDAVIDVLAARAIVAAARPDAPGVYVDGAKIASLGLRIRRGCSYHGLALNLDMDLSPFARIDPCGMAGLAVTRLADLSGAEEMRAVGADLVAALAAQLGIEHIEHVEDVPPSS